MRKRLEQSNPSPKEVQNQMSGLDAMYRQREQVLEVQYAQLINKVKDELVELQQQVVALQQQIASLQAG